MLTLSSMHTLKPISLYIHLPWCIKRCFYCDFNAHQQPQNLPIDAYQKRLMDDALEIAPIIGNRPINTIFFGGGTPNLCPASLFSNILDQLSKLFNIDGNIEITMEANPGASHLLTLKDYRTAGINRLSIGTQSFNNHRLKLLGRIHQANDAIAMIEHSQQLNFNSVNIDIMYGLPEQSIQEAMDDLKLALSLPIDHLSWYHLTIEPNTYFAKHPPKRAHEDDRIEMEDLGLAMLTEQQWNRYEISAYCKTPQHQCLHNLNYWNYGDFLSLGAGGHAKWRTQDGTILRNQRKRSPKAYLNDVGSTVAKQYELNQSDIIFEFMLNNLRLPKAILYEHFEQQTSLPYQVLTNHVQKLVTMNLAQQLPHGFELTQQGWRLLDHCTEVFLPE
ncbi:MAG: radical SAM family heme chaperone HemW [Candidatus Comchoanobacterales bacterium]